MTEKMINSDHIYDLHNRLFNTYHGLLFESLASLYRVT